MPTDDVYTTISQNAMPATINGMPIFPDVIVWTVVIVWIGLLWMNRGP